MVVLWITPILFPEAEALYKKREIRLSSSGGWMLGASEHASRLLDLELHIACPADVNRIVNLKGERIYYHLYKGPMLHDWSWHDRVFSNLNEIVRPDIIHIWGTEYSSTISVIRASCGIPVVLSIQGLLHDYAKHFFDGIPFFDLLKFGRPYYQGIIREWYEIYRRGKIEIKSLRLASNVIGRTSWDKKLVQHINPTINYFHCDEVLRPDYYSGVWQYNKCEKFTIFQSNGFSSFKGLHQMLKAMPIIIKNYPTAKLIVAGPNVIEMAKNGHNYSRIIVSMLKRLNLMESIQFCGNLDAAMMKNQLLNANVFVLPSTIDNSSNALAEAQILGVPVVASYRGGTPTMIPDDNCGKMFSFYNTKQLARLVCDCFEYSEKFDNNHMRDVAQYRHNPQLNNEKLFDIYKKCIAKKSE